MDLITLKWLPFNELLTRFVAESIVYENENTVSRENWQTRGKKSDAELIESTVYRKLKFTVAALAKRAFMWWIVCSSRGAK